MHFQPLVAGLALLGVAHAGIYGKNSAVLEVTAKNYDKLIANSNHTSVSPPSHAPLFLSPPALSTTYLTPVRTLTTPQILEFYAPWCGHCQNLKPAYEKAATNLAGLANVAAIDCDEDSNKHFCGSMGVKGFPTLKIVRPGKKTGKPVVDDYQGPRTATGIVEAVVDKMNNHVKRVTDKDMAGFLGEKNESAKALLFTEKGSTSALLKGIAIDFLDVVEVAQVRSKEAESVAMFGVTSFPTLILLPGGEKEGIVYEGEMKKAAIVEFLSQAGEPNPGAAAKPGKKKEPKKETKQKPAEEAPEPEPEKAAPQAAPITTLTTPEQLAAECLHPKAGTCVLALVPEEKHEGADALLASLAELVHRNAVAGRPLFPMYAVPAVNPAYAALKGGLGIEGEVELVAVNAKRGWWRRFGGEVEGGKVGEWVDGVKMGEGEKRKLPEGIVADAEAEKKTETESEKETEAEKETKTESEAQESKTAEDTHDEL